MSKWSFKEIGPVFRISQNTHRKLQVRVSCSLFGEIAGLFLVGLFLAHADGVFATDFIVTPGYCPPGKGRGAHPSNNLNGTHAPAPKLVPIRQIDYRGRPQGDAGICVNGWFVQTKLAPVEAYCEPDPQNLAANGGPYVFGPEGPLGCSRCVRGIIVRSSQFVCNATKGPPSAMNNGTESSCRGSIARDPTVDQCLAMARSGKRN
jgi:hypothetical protein